MKNLKEIIYFKKRQALVLEDTIASYEKRIKKLTFMLAGFILSLSGLHSISNFSGPYEEPSPLILTLLIFIMVLAFSLLIASFSLIFLQAKDLVNYFKLKKLQKEIKQYQSEFNTQKFHIKEFNKN